MKKSIALLLALTVIISSAFAACSSKKEKVNADAVTSTTDTNGLAGADTEYGIETDENGNEVDVVYETDKENNTVAYVIDKNGKKTTDKAGNNVTVKITTTKKSKTTTKKSDGKSTTASQDQGNEVEVTNAKTTTTTTQPATATTKKNVATTAKVLTTLSTDKDKVPSTSQTGTEVTFSVADQETIASMLEVPGLTNYSYENKSGVPATLAVHAAVWMAQREGLTSTTYPSGTVVLDLFKYFGQTAVNFKSDCNTASKKENTPINYNADKDTFDISKAESKKQTVIIEKVESLGNNNYYKITGKVSGVSGISSVNAIIQKNKLDSSLGFSIKALKWA